MTETLLYETARLSTPTKPLFSLEPLDATTWLRSLLSKVFHFLLVKRVKCSAILYSLTKQHNLVPRSSRLTVQFSWNRPLPSSKNPHFQNEARCRTFPVKRNEFYLHENEKLFPYQRQSACPCFETEARGNSEMVYYAAQLTSFLTYLRILPNLVDSSWLLWIIRGILANQRRGNIFNE